MATSPRNLRSLAMGCAGIWLVVAVGIVMPMVLAPDGNSTTLVVALVVAGVAGTALHVAEARRRADRISEAERIAKAIAAADQPLAGDRPGGGIPHEPPASGGEFAGLYESLDHLADRVEKQLKAAAKSARNLSAILDALDEPLIATDNHERVLLCNRSAEALLGAGGEPGALVGRPIVEVFTQSELRDMHAAARTGETRRLRVRVMTSVGQRTLQVSALPVPAAWGKGVFGAVMILRDVTEVDQAEHVKADFVANASHELRTPVSAIRMAAETLKEAVRDDPAMAERVSGMILSHAQRLEELLRDLLDLSRLESPEVQIASGAIDLHALKDSLHQQFDEILRERRLTLSVEFDSTLAGMQSDQRLLGLILRNLVENACKFAFEGTAVRVTGTVTSDETGTEHADRSPQATARFEVIDRGPGIPLAHQERVFERFYQVDAARSGSAARRGTGLGLAIVKHAARALKGHVGIESRWGEGTTAWVEVPVLLASAGGRASDR